MGLLVSDYLSSQGYAKKIWTCPDGEHWAVRVKAVIQNGSSSTVRFSLAVMPNATATPGPSNYIEKMVSIIGGKAYDSEPFSLSAGQTLYGLLEDTNAVNIHLFGVKI